MERKKIHNEGPEFSRIIAGAWRWTLDESHVEQLIHRSLDVGITTFDHADIYGDHCNEEIFGNVIRKDPSLRRQMEIVTKFGIRNPTSKRPSIWIKHYDTSKQHIIWSVENSLKMLNTDCIDLLLIHRPDPLLNPTDVADACDLLRKSGKVRHFGVSNFTPAQFEMLQSYLAFPLVTNQLQISITHNEPLFDGSLDVLMKHRVSPMGWAPLGGGKVMEGDKSELFKSASKYSASKSQMSLAWLLKHPSSIFPVIGTTKPKRIVESSRALDIDIDLQDWFEMLMVARGKIMP